MVAYPHLSPIQQQGLPEIQQATQLSAMFEDSTHQIWQCDTNEGSIILKLCNHHSVQKSVFWQGMGSLFGVVLPAQLAEFEQVYKKITALSPLTIPDYITSGSAVGNEDITAFILCQKLPGTMVGSASVDDAMVIDLAQHISQLHQCKKSIWGPLYSPNLDAIQWPKRLQDTLMLLAKQQTISPELLAEVISVSGNCMADYFVPIMPDLRWNQFLQHNGKLSSLVDLDAIVFAPRELELVLLEYILTEPQAKIFAQHYQQTHILPDLSQVRKPYRLLLFLMNVLGEKDINSWMQAPIRF